MRDITTNSHRTRVVLVACAGQKQDRLSRAEDLYTSPLFRKSRAFAERHGARWFILSAMHGLVPPNRLLHPYNQTLNAMSAADRRTWAALVASNLAVECKPAETHLIFLAGKHYREPLTTLVERMGFTTEAPMAHLGIGKQLAWLTARE